MSDGKMISKNMYKVLNILPHAPATMSFQELYDMCKISHCRLIELLEEAKKHNYIDIVFFQSDNNMLLSDLYLTEAGQTAIEEHKKQKSSSAKSTWAIIISALSFIASAVAVVLSICGVQ